MSTSHDQNAHALAYPHGKKAKGKIKKTMDEWKAGTLHSGSQKGPKVTNQKQAVAIALSQARRAQGGS